MKTNFFLLVEVIALTAVGLLSASNCKADGPYHFIKEIPIGGDGGWDYLSLDSAAQRFYVSHASKIVVIDLAKDTVVGEITNTPGVHGIAIAPELGLGVTSNGRENKAGIVNLKTFQTLAKLDTAEGPDSMIYNSAQKEAYLFCGRAQVATVVDVKSQKVAATIPLGGRPEFAQADPEANRIYDNLENKSEVAVIDGKTHTIVTNWPTAPGEGPSGMAIDVAHHKIFLGCGGSKTMEMMDATSGKVLASVPIGDGVDANAFDPETQLAFASCGDGTTTIAKEDGDKLTVVQTLATHRGARTMALDPATHKIYLAAAEYAAATNSPATSTNQMAAPRRQRPQMIPGTFKILVYGMDK
jgi:DNA-binding beta-propeller fold protein YncE